MEVSDFGGEGTGLKSMKDVCWAEGEVVTFTVTGSLSGDDGAWTCGCWFSHHGVRHHMATFRRRGDRPLSGTGFYSFVEDWDRCQGAEGHLDNRR